MTAAANVRLYAAYNEAQNAHDVKRIAEFFAPDAVTIIYGILTLHGQKEIETFYNNLFEGRPDYRGRIVDIIADDDRVYAELEFTATYSGPNRRPDGTVLPPTGKSYKTTGMSRVRIDNGKITEVFTVLNEADRMRQVGLL